MSRLCFFSGFIVLLLLAFVPGAAEAYTFEIKGIYWPTTPTISNAGGQFGNWNTSAYGGDLRLFLTPSWGLHLQYATGSEGSWGGTYSTATSGTDTVYSGDFFYEWRLGVPMGREITPFDLRAFAGYGQIQTSTTFPAGQRIFTSNGARLGADFVLPFPKSRLALQGGVAWYPSNSTSLNLFGPTTTSSAGAWDYTVSVQYTDPTGWLLEGGYRWVTADTGPIGASIGCPCTTKIGGVFFGIGYRY